MNNTNKLYEIVNVISDALNRKYGIVPEPIFETTLPWLKSFPDHRELSSKWEEIITFPQ